MGKIMEAVFCVFYMVLVTILGTKTVKEGKTRGIRLFGIMCLVLVAGDAFHLVPRVLAAVNRAGDYHAAMGIGTLITSVTMTVFYVIMYFVYSMRYGYKNKALAVSVIALAALRIALCLFPQNDWTGDSPVSWGIYRNIPFVIMGVITVMLFYKKRADRPFKFMWLAVIFSFLFYLPVVLWADASPMVGMLMLPKTCMYIWAVIMGYRIRKEERFEV